MNGVKRSLFACPIFSYTGSGSADDLTNWKDGSSTTLSAHCTTNTCCTGNSAQPACANNWNTQATYGICPNSCLGNSACEGIAQNAASGSTVQINSGACDSKNSCKNIQNTNTGVVNVIVEANECRDSNNACQNCGQDSTFIGNYYPTITCCSETGTIDEQCNADEASDAPSEIPSGE